jgi:serine/threonine protein kinase
MSGERIGDYEILGPIGRGGSAEILLARRVSGQAVGEPVVIKRLLPEVVDDPTFVRLLKREAAITRDLVHSNITRVFEFGEDDGQFFLAVEFVRGWDLAQIMGQAARRGEAFPIPLALYVIRELAQALQHAHERRDASGKALGLVHRDVSPSNVLVSIAGAIKLADFGIARAVSEARASATTWLRGKVAYMSPEQARGEPLDQQSDLFSLGIVLWELIALRRAYRGDSDVEVLGLAARGAIPNIQSVRTDVPESVRALLGSLLAPAREARCESAGHLLRQLTVALGEGGETLNAETLSEFVLGLDLPNPPDPEGFGSRPELLPAASEPPPANAASVAPRPAGAARRGRFTWLRLALTLGVALGVGVALRWGFERTARTPTRIEVRSLPAGAKVFIDGVHRGETPFVTRELEPRVVEVRVSRQTRDYKRTIDLATTPDVVLDVDLGQEQR